MFYKIIFSNKFGFILETCFQNKSKFITEDHFVKHVYSSAPVWSRVTHKWYDLPENMSGTNDLAYFAAASVIMKKRYITLTPDGSRRWREAETENGKSHQDQIQETSKTGTNIIKQFVAQFRLCVNKLVCFIIWNIFILILLSVVCGSIETLSITSICRLSVAI
jgi:hypothetical protein